MAIKKASINPAVAADRLLMRYMSANDLLRRLNASDSLRTLLELHAELAGMFHPTVSDGGTVVVKDVSSPLSADGVLVGGIVSLGGKRKSVAEWERMRKSFVIELNRKGQPKREPDYYSVVCALYRDWLGGIVKRERVRFFEGEEGRRVLADSIRKVVNAAV